MAGRSKRIDTKVSILLGLQFPLFHSLAKIGERRPLRKGERQSGYRGVSFSAFSQFTDSVLLHMRFHLRRELCLSVNSCLLTPNLRNLFTLCKTFNLCFTPSRLCICAFCINLHIAQCRYRGPQEGAQHGERNTQEIRHPARSKRIPSG